MTREDHRLDPSLLTSKNPLPLYRLAKTKYANLSGVGAATYPGRWNHSGQEAIYTSTELGVPVLERLAHTAKDMIPTDLSRMHLNLLCNGKLRASSYPDCVMFRTSAGGTFVAFETLRAARHGLSLRGFFEDVFPFAVALPSVIVPVWNVVLYPAGLFFWESITLKSLEPFLFDPRLFPDKTQSEVGTAS